MKGYNTVNNTNLVHDCTMCPSSEETTVFMWRLVLVILCGCLVCRSICFCIPDTWYLLFCVDDWYAGAYASAYQTLGTCYPLWMTGKQEHMLLHTRHLILVILCGWLVCRSICLCIPDSWYLLFSVDDWYAGAYASAYQTVIHTEWQVPSVA